MIDAPEAAPVVAPKAASAAEESGGTGLASTAIVPPLTVLAAIAVVADLVFRRGLLRTGTVFVDDVTRLSIVEPLGRLSATLLGLSATVALAFALAPLVLRSDLLTLARRAGLALFVSLFMPSLLTAIFLPLARTTPPMVLVGTVASGMLCFSLGLVAIEWRGPLGVRVTCTMAALAALGAFLSIAIAIIGAVYEWPPGESVASAARDVGELAYLVTPVVLSATFLAEARGPSVAARFGVAAALVLVSAVAFVAIRIEIGPSYPTMLYGALRLATFASTSSLPYALAFGMAIGTAYFGASSRSPIDRQLGAAILLFFLAGYGPRSPAQLVATTLATTLLARAVIASSRAGREST